MRRPRPGPPRQGWRRAHRRGEDSSSHRWRSRSLRNRRAPCRPARSCLELDQRAAHGATPDILGLDHVEAELRQFSRDGVGVVHRLLQLRHVLIGVVADDEGDAVCRISLGGGKESKTANGQEEARSAPATATIEALPLPLSPPKAMQPDRVRQGEVRRAAAIARCRSGPRSTQDRD